MSWASNFTLTVEKPVAVAPWATAPVAVEPVEAPAYQSDENLKKQFGIELAKATNPFEAGCKVFGEETNKALWASFNWLTDPIVIATRDAYLKTLELSSKPLDREQLAAKVLKLAEGEKVVINGIERPTIDAKERINAYKLYSDILGYTGKVEIDNSTNSITTNNNKIEVVLVKAEVPKPTVINATPNVKSENTKDLLSPINLKLVKAG